jgi:NADPH-dependent 2,4-dienoyl-CoA reductase/sulfur reductase-like enzyme/ferredoxin
MYAKFVLYVGASVGGFSLLDTFWHGATSKLTALYGALAFNLFYWFGLPGWFNALGSVIHVTPSDILPRSMQVVLLGLTFVWGVRTFHREPLFLREFKSNDDTKIDFAAEQAVQAEIKFMPTDVVVTATGGRTLLEIAVTNRQPIEADCSTGTCGADPVLILDGAENLSPATNTEKQILALLGLGPNCRLACMARVRGPVTVLLPPSATAKNLRPSPRIIAPLQPAPSATMTAPAAITFMPGQVQAPIKTGQTILEIAESQHLPLTANCRLGMCGADPVCILDGMENLAPMGNDEKATLERLGLGANCRLACVSRLQGAVTVSLDLNAAPANAIAPALPPNQNEIVFMPDETRAPLNAGQTLLEIAENANQPIEAGCRMGVCGADPILVLDGMENLNPIGNDEKNTLERLGLGANCRLACMCRAKGPVTLSLQTKGATSKVIAPPTVKKYDRNLKQVVIIGNGVAGITAADYVRRNHPDCEIHVISKEKHHFYNRIGIMRLIYGRSAMSGLYLQPEAWYDEHHITCWLNTHVTHINRGHKQVQLATGEHLTYDRLVLANGSSSYVPPIPGFGMPGTFVLREAEEAMEIRAYVQQHHSKSAVVAGGGLLGLEAAYALHQLGLTVWVLERGDWLLRRQLDERAGHILKQRVEALGLIIETRAEAAAIEGAERVTQVNLTSGHTLPCDVFLVAAGIQPNVELARRAGLKVNRGILVDKKMRTNAPGIFAAGDVCEFEHEVPGLWHVAVEQARVAAINAVGGDAVYQPSVPVAMLKVVGVDVLSIGKFQAHAKTDTEIVLADADEQGYRKLVLAQNKLVGAILIGHSVDAPAVSAAVKAHLDVTAYRNTLETGDWRILAEQ